MGKRQDLTGQRFGKWTVLKESRTDSGTRGWLCKCDCGAIHVVITSKLISGASKGCRDCSGKAFQDLTGQKFERLYVISRNKDKHIKSVVFWNCICDCGNKCIVSTTHLKSGHSKSCGCYSRDNNAKRFTTHGLSNHPLYGIWSGIKDRCTNETRAYYNNYGGRGIKMCDEWFNDFESFYTWAIENGWKKGLSIDRIDNNGDYCPNNCRWVDIITQANNCRRNVYLEYNGETHTLAEWSRIVGIKSSTISRRLQLGWSVEKALTKPIQKQNRMQ